MGSNIERIERGSEKAKDASIFLARMSFRTGRAMVGGTYAPIAHLWGIERDAKGFKEKTIGAIVVLSPALPGVVVGSITHDLDLGVLISVGGLYAEGMGISLIYEFFCPPDKRSLRKKLRSLGRNVYIPRLSRFQRHSRLHLPK